MSRNICRSQARPDWPQHKESDNISLPSLTLEKRLEITLPDHTKLVIAPCSPIIKVHPGVSDSMLSEIETAIGTYLPEDVRRLLYEHDVKITLCPFMTDGFPELKSNHGSGRKGGWAKDSSADNCGGMWCYGTREVAITEKVINYWTKDPTETTDRAMILRHEVGHAVDLEYHGGDWSMLLSKQAGFLKSYNADRREISKQPEEARKLAYFLQRGAGPGEAFASAFATAISQGAEAEREFGRHFHRSVEHIRNDVLSRLG